LLVFIFDRRLKTKLQLKFNLLLKLVILLRFSQFILIALLKLKKEIKIILREFYTTIIQRIE